MFKYLGLKLAGKLLASSLGSYLLTRYAFRTPHRHLFDLDGSLYMARWRVVDEDSFGSRVLEKLTGYASVRLHRIMRSDHDRDLHNHPFAYRTFIVKGGYAEQGQAGLYGDVFHRTMEAGDTGATEPWHYHRIAEVSDDGVWTLFFMTRNKGTWGFNVAGKFMQSTRYLLRKGYTRTHVEEVQTL